MRTGTGAQRRVAHCDANIVIHGALIPIERKSVLNIPAHVHTATIPGGGLIWSRICASGRAE